MIDTFTREINAFYGLAADYPSESLRQEHDLEAPQPFVIWCDVGNAEDIVGAGFSLGAAVAEARQQLKGWNSK